MSLDVLRVLVLLEIDAFLLFNNIYDDTLEIFPGLSYVNLA